MNEDRREGDGKIWAAIEELRRGQAVREQKLDAFEQYQRERNHQILNALNGSNGQLTMLRDEMQKQREDMLNHWNEQQKENQAFFKKGIWFLGAVITALVAYIWQDAFKP